MKYRAEIDGLRALAVIPVILFHAGFDLFSGGFVGVDVFFVISGYLITTIILSEMENGTFSLVNFYERRARRILPALFLVMLISLPAAYLWLLPADLKDFSQSLIAISTFTSNILFWQETGYWEVASELKPLLHTWSLAVEEQYYVLFPIYLMIMWRFRKRWIVGSFMLITAISLGVAQWGAYNKPSATFFLLPTRGWELAIGASIAFYFLFRKQAIRNLLSHKSVDEVLSLVGLLMIGYAVYAFDETVPFPSLYALIPTIGTGLIILFSSPHTLVGRLLGTKLLVGVGLISYSAYLWHYPLLAFARHRSITEPSEALFLLLALISFPLAYISWRFVESPFRQKARFSRNRIFVYSAIGSLFFAVVGLLGVYTKGFPARAIKGTEALDYGQHWNGWERCDIVKAPVAINGGCHLLFKNQPIDVLVIGDSHAGHLATGLRELYLEKGVNVAVMLHAACYPFYPFVYDGSLRFNCPGDLIKNALDFAIETDSIETVILSGYSSLVIYKSRFHQDVVANSNEIASNVKAFELGLLETLNALVDAKKKVFFIQDNPELLKDPQGCLRAGYTPECNSINITKNEYLKRNSDILSVVNSNLHRFDTVTFIDTASVFCDDEKCYGYKNGVLLYATRDHLTPTGSRLFISSLGSILLPSPVN